MAHFNNESLQVQDKDEKIVMAVFINDLRINELYYKLVKKSPRTLEELLNRVYAAAKAEEAARLKIEFERDLEDR
mgnify:FL=1